MNLLNLIVMNEKEKIRARVNYMFAMAEYEQKYNMPYDECIKKRCFPFRSKLLASRYKRIRARGYSGKETANSLEITEQFVKGNNFFEQLQAKLGVEIMSTETIDDIVEKVWHKRRNDVIASVQQQIELWQISENEIFNRGLSIH